jgi:hypothetical protein
LYHSIWEEQFKGKSPLAVFFLLHTSVEEQGVHYTMAARIVASIAAHPLISTVVDRSNREGPNDIAKLCQIALRSTAEYKNTRSPWRFVREELRRPNVETSVHRAELERILDPSVWVVGPLSPRGNPRIPATWKATWDAASACQAVCHIVGHVAQSRLDQGLEVAVYSASLGGKCIVSAMHCVSGHWNGKCRNPFIEAPHASWFLLEEATQEGYKHMWLLLNVTTPNGSSTDLYIDPTASQFGSPKAIVSWHDDNPNPGIPYDWDFMVTTRPNMLAEMPAHTLEEINSSFNITV